MEKGGVLHLNKLESPSPKDALCQVWLKLALKLVLEMRRKCEKFTTTKRRRRQWQRLGRRRTTDKFWSGKLTWAFGSFELKSCLKCGLWGAVQDWIRCTILVYTSRRILMLAQCYSNDVKQTSLNLASLDVGPMLFNQQNKTIYS